MLNKSSGGCSNTDQQERQMECYRIRRLVEVSPLLSVYRIVCRWVNQEPPDPHPPAPYQKRNGP